MQNLSWPTVGTPEVVALASPFPGGEKDGAGGVRRFVVGSVGQGRGRPAQLQVGEPVGIGLLELLRLGLDESQQEARSSPPSLFVLRGHFFFLGHGLLGHDILDHDSDPFVDLGRLGVEVSVQASMMSGLVRITQPDPATVAACRYGPPCGISEVARFKFWSATRARAGRSRLCYAVAPS